MEPLLEEEYTLFCGKKLLIAKVESDYFKDELTDILLPCKKYCPDEAVSGLVSCCPVFNNNFEYTLVCGKKVKLTADEWKYVHEPLTTEQEVCAHKCPNDKIQGDVNSCKTFLEADTEDYADDPDYQDFVRRQCQNEKSSNRQKKRRSPGKKAPNKKKTPHKEKIPEKV